MLSKIDINLSATIKKTEQRMGKKRSGRNISGWIPIDKPVGHSSSALVRKVKWALNAQKAGHAGTLDPEASGVLAVALGEATKTVQYVTNALKCYEFTVRFGSATNTDDAVGEIISQSTLRPTDGEIEEALFGFTGHIEQIPPKFSAIKVNGERAYALARQGEDISLKARPIFVDSLRMTQRPDLDHAVLTMVCGKGGYVRSIARDLGKKLGCYGYVKSLRRTWAGPFHQNRCLDVGILTKLARTPELDAHLRPLQTGLTGLTKLHCSAESVKKLQSGHPVPTIEKLAVYKDRCWVAYDGKPIAIGEYRAGVFHPTRVFVLDNTKSLKGDIRNRISHSSL